LLEVPEALKAAGVDDRIRSAATTIYQALIEAELTRRSARAPDARTAQRNGSRPRMLTTTAGDLEAPDPEASGRVLLPFTAGTPPDESTRHPPPSGPSSTAPTRSPSR